MATQAQETKGTAKPHRQPISTHRAFPPIVALWFAALLGLGSLVVPVEVIERLVTATGIASLVPATAPPLGFTARALIALTFLVSGAIAGFVIARAIGKAHRPEGAPVRASRKPISAHSELGEDGFDGRPVRGRRTLAIKEEEGPSEFLDHAPLPGRRVEPEPHVEVAEVAADTQELELTDLVAEDFPAPAAFAAPKPVEPVAEAAPSLYAADGTYTPLGHAETEGLDDPVELTVEPLDEARSARQDFLRPKKPEPVDERQMFRPIAEEAPEDSFAPSEEIVAETAHDEALPDWHEDYAGTPIEARIEVPALEEEEAPRQVFQPFAAPAAEPAAEPEIEPAAVAEVPVEADEPELVEEEAFAAPFSAPQDHYADQTAEEPAMAEEPTQYDSAADQPLTDTEAQDLDDLGLVQLAMRLGASIERRRAMREARQQLQASTAAVAPVQPVQQAIPPRPAPAAFGIEVEDEMMDDAADAMAAFFGGPGKNEAPETPAATAPAAPKAVFEEPVTEEEPAAPETPYNRLAGFAKLGLDAQFDDEDEDDGIDEIAASLSLPLARKPEAAPMPRSFDPPAAAPAPAEPAAKPEAAPLSFAPPPQARFIEADDSFDEDEHHEEEGEDYGSLLALRNPFQNRPAERVRIEDEPEEALGAQPAVIFPAEAERKAASANLRPVPSSAPAAAPAETLSKADLEENERALREALMNLQRMSGAA